MDPQLTRLLFRGPGMKPWSGFEAWDPQLTRLLFRDEVIKACSDDTVQVDVLLLERGGATRFVGSGHWLVGAWTVTAGTSATSTDFSGPGPMQTQKNEMTPHTSNAPATAAAAATGKSPPSASGTARGAGVGWEAGAGVVPFGASYT